MLFGTPQNPRSPLQRYGIALAIAGLAFFLSVQSGLAVGSPPFALMFAAVGLCAWFGGFGPGFFAVAAGTALFLVFWKYTCLPGESIGGLLSRLTVFVSVGIFISILSESLHRARRRLEASLAEIESGEKRLRLLVDAVEEYSICMLDTEGKVVGWNKGAERMHGFSESEMLGRDCTVIMSEEELIAQRHVEFMSKALELGSVRAECMHLRKDGTAFPSDVLVSAVRNPSGEVTGFAIVGRDLTSQKREEELLKQTEEHRAELRRLEAIGRLAGGIAHDFNNILTAITGYSDLTLERLPKDGALRGNLTEIMKAADRAAALTRQILAFGRKQVMQPKLTNLNDLIRALAANLQRLAGDRIEIELALDNNLGSVHADTSQIECALMNMAVNASEAMPEGGRLMIQTANVTLESTNVGQLSGLRAGDCVAITISDTGVGMDSETVSKIFEPFYTTKGRGVGVGLRLSTALGIISQSSGHLTVHSEPGRGTTFHIYFPRVAPADQPRDAAAPKTQLHLAGSETILLVEDEKMLREVAKKILEARGYRVLVAANGEEGAGIAAGYGGEIHIVVSDIIMPGMSGPEMAVKVEKSRPGTRFLFISGFADESALSGIDLSSGSHFLQKPFTGEVLAAKVREVLQMEIKKPEQAA